MGTELDTGQRASGPPSAKLRNIGDHLNFAVIDINNEVTVTKFGTNEPELRNDGTVKLGIRLAVMVLGGNAVRVEKQGDATVDVPLQVGEVASVFIDGYSKWDPSNDTADASHVSWGKAIDRLTSSGSKFQVGTVGQWAYLRDLPSQQAGNNARKDRKFALRAAAPEEAAQSQRCEQLRVELQSAAAPAPTQLPSTTAPQPALSNF